MLNKEKRFEKKSYNDFLQIVVDKQTGVQYLLAPSSGLTPLLDANGKPILAAEKE